MTTRSDIPESVVRLAPGESFSFDCHPGVPCFTECCRLLELPLTPYDVLRLRRGTGLTSQQLHDHYIIEELAEDDIFPRYYLTMVDDGRASCAFVGPAGCRVYGHRPAACRAYPLGRAAMRAAGSTIEEYHVLLKEGHCRGFEQFKPQTVQEYSISQGLDLYNRFNDAIAPLLQHEQIRNGSFTPTPRQRQLYTLVLYNIDTFQAVLAKGRPGLPSCPDDVRENDEKLLLFGIELLLDRFFGGQAEEI